jgi:hypothetical protein
MNLTQEKVLLHLTGKTDLSQLTAERLQRLADESPYFAPAHFFLSARLKGQGKPAAWTGQVQKTSLYFSDPYWLQFQLDSISIPEAENTQPVTEPAPVERIEKAIGITVPTIEAVRELMRKMDASQETTGEMEEEPLPDEYVEESEAIAETDPTENKIAGILSSQLADFKKPVEASDTLEIDADRKRLHTVDYFASQGIKIDLSSIPSDKLTTHLLKFTDWLKQVKNINANPHDLGTNPEMEKAVAETREIVTEAMADVLEKQGQTDKAIQLYIKLSFINPEKSSYFAAKIEQLKGI